MPAGGISTFDGNPNATPAVTNGYRPGPSDFNGAALKDDPVNPPDPQTMPTSALLNGTELTLVSMGKAVAVGGIGINASATPTVAFFWIAANLVVGNPYNVVRNAAGDYSITWASNLLPIVGWPKPYLNVQLGAHEYAIGAVNITNGVRVTTVEDGALADLNFSVDFF
jgi:hypothetical protein